MATALALAVLGAGCTAQQQSKSTTTAAPTATSAKPAPAPAGYRTAAAAFPTGNKETSALWVEKTVPAEVLVGQPFDVVYKVSNLTDLTLQDVTLTANAGSNFTPEQATPEPDKVDGNEGTWVIGDLPARGTKEIRIRGAAAAEGFVTGCGSVTFRPVLCETVKVVKPAIELVKTMPAQVIQCDPIAVKLVVRNNGSSALTGVRVADSLPAGLLTDGGQSSVAFDAGTLAPGESKEFAFNATATKTGVFKNPAKATSAQGVEAAAEASVKVVKPVLTLACETPVQKEILGVKYTEFIGRPFTVCWEIKNTGDAPSAGTILYWPLSNDLTLRSTTDGGALKDGNVVWDLGTLAPGASKKVCATVSGNVSIEDFRLTAKVTGACAEPAVSACNVFIMGVNAILVEVVDDPDPIQVGEQTTYTVRVTNQGGGIDLRDLVIKAKFPEGMDPGVASNGGQISGKSVVWPTVAALPVKQSVSYTVTGKAVKAGDNRLEVEVMTRARQSPITETESTTAY